MERIREEGADLSEHLLEDFHELGLIDGIEAGTHIDLCEKVGQTRAVNFGRPLLEPLQFRVDVVCSQDRRAKQGGVRVLQERNMRTRRSARAPKRTTCWTCRWTLFWTRMLKVSLRVALIDRVYAPFGPRTGSPILVFGTRLRLMSGRTPRSFGKRRT